MTTIKKGVVLKAIRSAIDRALTKSPQSNYAQGKAYELKVLVHLLSKLRKKGDYELSCNLNPTGSTPEKRTLTFGGSPCQPNADEYNCINVKYTPAGLELEFWISVQVTTLSYELGKIARARAGNPSKSPERSDLHEVDIGLYRPLKTKDYPSYKNLMFSASCKSGTWRKAFVREALGLRRELGYVSDQPKHSLAPWFTPAVHSHPSAPLALYSSDLRSKLYKGSLDKFGLFVERLA